MKNSSLDSQSSDRGMPWYSGISGYQWLVLIIASAGWVFDVYESQIFNLTRKDLLLDILGGDESKAQMWGEWMLAVFLAGGTTGGLLFGSLADRFGARSDHDHNHPDVFRVLRHDLLCDGHLSINRITFSGIGGHWRWNGRWPQRWLPKCFLRERALRHPQFSMDPAYSVPGWPALAALAVGSNWRYAFLLGVLPALLVLWVRSSIQEPEKWKQRRATAPAGQMGSFRELLLNPLWQRRAIVGMLLAAVGLGTFWCVTIAGQDIAREFLLKQGSRPADAEASSKFAYGIVQATGGGIGLLAFGPIAAWLGRRPAFALFHVLGLLIVPIVLFSTPNLLAATGNAASLWILDDGYAFGLRNLFPRALSNAPARHWNELLFQWWAIGSSPHPAVFRGT